MELLLSDKFSQSPRTTFSGKDNRISNYYKLAKTLNNFLANAVGNLNIIINSPTVNRFSPNRYDPVDIFIIIYRNHQPPEHRK